MPVTLRQLRPIARVALPVVVATSLVCLAAINVALVHSWRGEPEDGVLWGKEGVNVVAFEVLPGSAADRAGLRRGDAIFMIDDRPVNSDRDIIATLHQAADHRAVKYLIQRQSAQVPITVELQPMPVKKYGLYYSLAIVGLLAITVGASVRLRRPTDHATLHFFWVTVAFFGMFAFTASGRYNHLDYFFDWADAVARLMLPPLFLHFALVFPERPHSWVRTDAGRALVPVIYLPALLLGGGRAALMARGMHGPESSRLMEQIEVLTYGYLALCLVGGLVLMLRALTRLRSVTARRQMRWIVWGLSVGALPFVALYFVPFAIGRPLPYAEYTSVLLGCVPLAFASALVRYRLMDVEVIVKRGLVVAAVGLLLAVIYGGTLRVAGLISGRNAGQSNSWWALFATFVVALVAPWLWRSIQTALDRLYYRDRFDYRRALVSFARELNSDLDLDRLSTRLVTRVRDTLAADKIALFLPAAGSGSADFVAVASQGFDGGVPSITRSSALGIRLSAGHTVVLDDAVPARRLGAEHGEVWREVGLFCFLPCVLKDATIAVLGVGRKAQGEPVSSEDLTLLGTVAGQAATALENARLYEQLRVKADEIERLRQFSDSVVESLSDGLLVVDLDDRVLRWNRRLEELIGIERGRAVGRRFSSLFSKPFVDTMCAARRESPAGATLYRVPLTSSHGGAKRSLLVNTGIAPFQTTEGSQAGWIVVVEDVTDRANLEEQLRLSEKMAAIGLLAAGVAHEVNTPLTGISSFTQMLLERADPADPKTELLEKIERQTFRAAKIINSLLNLARPSEGETGPVDLNVIVGDILSLLEHQFRMSHIQVRKDLASPAVFVQGVEYKLQQVFLNLFLNARDAMTKGGWLSIATRVEGAEAIVEVADTGAGIPSEHLARIYDPFFTTKPEGRGTGLGLSVTYGIVQEHGGTLTCESDVGKGTRFRLMLPLKRAAAVASGGST